MKKRHVIMLALFLIVPGLLFTASCSKKTVRDDVSGVSSMQDDQAMQAERDRRARERAGEQDRLREDQLSQQREEAMRREREMAAREFTGNAIYFEFDSSVLTPEAQSILREKVAFMKEFGRESARLEGNCDNRGTEEYNLALGERRARTAKMFMVNLGIAPRRLMTISYGEEHAAGMDEYGWAKDRRVDFVLK